MMSMKSTNNNIALQRKQQQHVYCKNESCSSSSSSIPQKQQQAQEQLPSSYLLSDEEDDIFKTLLKKEACPSLSHHFSSSMIYSVYKHFLYERHQVASVYRNLVKTSFKFDQEAFRLSYEIIETALNFLDRVLSLRSEEDHTNNTNDTGTAERASDLPPLKCEKKEKAIVLMMACLHLAIQLSQTSKSFYCEGPDPWAIYLSKYIVSDGISKILAEESRVLMELKFRGMYPCTSISLLRYLVPSPTSSSSSSPSSCSNSVEDSFSSSEYRHSLDQAYQEKEKHVTILRHTASHFIVNCQTDKRYQCVRKFKPSSIALAAVHLSLPSIEEESEKLFLAEIQNHLSSLSDRIDMEEVKRIIQFHYDVCCDKNGESNESSTATTRKRSRSSPSDKNVVDLQNDNGEEKSWDMGNVSPCNKKAKKTVRRSSSPKSTILK